MTNSHCKSSPVHGACVIGNKTCLPFSGNTAVHIARSLLIGIAETGTPVVLLLQTNDDILMQMYLYIT